MYSDIDIRRALDSGALVVEPYNRLNIQRTSEPVRTAGCGPGALIGTATAALAWMAAGGRRIG